MGLSISPYQSRSVHCENHMELLHAHIMKHLIYSALQKGGINCHNRNHAPKGKSCGKGNRMLLRNSHIKETVRIPLGKLLKPGSSRHGCCDGSQFLLFLCLLAKRLRKHICISRTGLLLRRSACLHIKRPDSVEHIRIASGRLIAPAFFCKHMNHNRSFHTLGFIEKTHHLAHIVPVYRS